MKKLFLSLVALIALVASSSAAEKGKENLKFVDATTLNICGHTMRTEKSPYFRFDCEPYNFKEEAIRRYSRYSAGMYVVFHTNSSQVWATWENVKRRCGDNMTPIFQQGVDLYIKDGNEWRFCGIGRVSTDPEKNCRTKPLIQNLHEGDKEFMLYLPYWCELTRLEIGVDKDATIEAIPSPYKHRVVTYGTSTLHAASPSRPGMGPLARMSRALGIDFVNFCYSGQGKMEPESAAVLADCQTDAIICYCFGNTTPDQIAERVDGFAASIVKAHPDKAIIFLPPFLNGKYHLDQVKSARAIEKRAVLARKMAALTKKYKNVHYIDIPDACGTDGEASIDNSHPNDLGFDRILQNYGPKIAKILKKHGIKPSKQ